MDKKSIIVTSSVLAVVAGAGYYFYLKSRGNWFDYNNISFKVDCDGKYEKFIYDLTYDTMRKKGYDLYYILQNEDGYDMLDKKGKPTSYTNGDGYLYTGLYSGVIYARPVPFSKLIEVVPEPSSSRLNIIEQNTLYKEHPEYWSIATNASSISTEQQKIYMLKKDLVLLKNSDYPDKQNALESFKKLYIDTQNVGLCADF